MKTKDLQANGVKQWGYDVAATKPQSAVKNSLKLSLCVCLDKTNHEYIFIVCIAISTSLLQNITSPSPPLCFFFPRPLLFLETVQTPTLFLGNALVYIGFVLIPPPLHLENQIFQWIPIILKFSILYPIPSFKNNQILSQNFPVFLLS